MKAINMYKKSIYCLVWSVCLAGQLFLSGCGDFFEKKATEIETRRILNDLSEVKKSSYVNNKLPELYLSEPKRIKVDDGVKVFYFCKNLPADSLKNLIVEQLGFKVTANSAANQLIVHCNDDKTADSTIAILERADVPPIQVNIDCLVLERFADVTMDWETQILIEDLFGTGMDFGSDRITSDGVSPAFPGASLREAKRSTFGLDVGIWKNKGITGEQFRAAVDMLVSRGYLKTLMNPTLETVNGKQATIVSKEFAPIERIVTGENIDFPYSLTDYKWVEDTLVVTPFAYADGTISLATEIKIGSRSKPEGVVQQSIITERSTSIAENRIRPGDSLIISGIRKTELRSVIRGVPFFQDLPLIGVLFSSKDYEEKGTEIIFILTPSISSNGQDHEKLVEDIAEKFKIPKPKGGLEEFFTNPFSDSAYTEYVERKATEAEYDRLVAEIKRAEADEKVEFLKEDLLKVVEQSKQKEQNALKLRLEAEKAFEKIKAEREKAQEAVKKANAQAEAAKQLAAKEKQRADELAKTSASDSDNKEQD